MIPTISWAEGPTTARGDAEAGALLYRSGLRPDGQAIAAQRAGGGALPAHAAACMGCHRASAWGGGEGGVFVPPIAGRVLFAPGRPDLDHPRLQRRWLRHQTRSAYTERSLGRALKEGIDPDGNLLSSAMPRYTLDEAALADLSAYLRQRGSESMPGFDGKTLQLATVITPQAPAPRRQAVETAMERWSDGLRFGSVQVAWRPWRLQGEPHEWPAQLEAFWRDQPVYALVSGAGGTDWAGVDAWSRSHRVPSIFPSLDRIPDETDRSHWSMYLSAGVDGEARMVALRLQSQPLTRVVQWAQGPAGMSAARTLAAERRAHPAAGATETAGPDTASPALDAHSTAVLWLDSTQVQQWLAQHAPDSVEAVIVSAQLAPPATVEIPVAWRAKLSWVSLRADPIRQRAGAALSLRAWLHRLQIPESLDNLELADVHAATFFFGDALAQARSNFDQEVLLERLENVVNLRPAGAVYARLSLGPGQRVAAQGGYFLAYRPPAYQELSPLKGYVRAGD